MNRYEAVSHALRTNVGKSTRAEDIRHYDELFVDTIDASALETNTNQLIYGRRGSGKTLMLGALNERIQAQFPNTSVISFYYDATKFRSSAEYDESQPSIKERTHAFFNAFIEQLAQDIFDLADKILKRPTWLGALTLAGAQNAAKRDTLTALVLELLEAAGYGTDSPQLGSEPSTDQEILTHHNTQGSTAGLNATLDTRSLTRSGARAGFDFQKGATFDRTTRRKRTKTSTRRFKPYRVRELLVEIVELLGLEYVVIFLDEWMSLAECQIEFAQRLRECFFGESRIAVKIAADQYQGQFHNSGQGHNFRGLEIGGDIFVEVDLDRPFRDPERKADLFTEALYRRLAHFSDYELQAYFGAAPISNPERFIETLFTTRQAFVELCVGAQGLCRDFLELFKICAKDINSTVTASQAINFETVRRALVEHTEQTYTRAKKSMDSNTLLFGIINPHIKKTESRFFILESKPGRFTVVVNDLLTKRVIHLLPDAVLHPSIRGRYDCFEIAYGIYIDLMRATEYATGQQIAGGDTTDAAIITADNADTFLLDLSPLSKTADNVRLVLCPHCQKEFYSNEKAYEARRICPYCFLDQPELGV